MVSLHVLIKKYAAVVKATSRCGHSRDSGNFQQIFDAKVFNKFFHPNFREKFSIKFSGEIFNQIFRWFGPRGGIIKVGAVWDRERMRDERPKQAAY